VSIRHNTAYNLVGATLPIAVSLITLPIYLEAIGEARYGVLAVAWLLLGYFGLFDLGLGRATAQRIAALRNDMNCDRAKTLWTAAALNLGFGAVGGLIIWPLAYYYFRSVMAVEEQLRDEMLGAVFWMALALPLSTLISVLNGALMGRERFLQLNIINTIGTVFFQVAPLSVVLIWGPDLRLILPAALAVRSLTLILLLWRCLRHVSDGLFVQPERAEAVTLLRFGGWVTVSSIIGPMMVILDRFIIGAFLGAKAVAYYAVPFQLASQSTVFAGALSGSLFPRMANVTRSEEQGLGLSAIKILVAAMTPIMMIAILMAQPFLGWWISSDLATQSGPIAHILLLGFWFNGMAHIPITMLQASGRPNLVAKCHMIEIVPYFLLLYFGMSHFGLVGVATAFSIRTAVDFFFLTGFSGLLKRVLPIIVLPGCNLAGAMIIANSLPFGSHGWYAASAALLGLFIGWLLLMRPEAFRKSIPSRLHFIHKIKGSEK
jgi:O-antigen/teichoic acid export membrane protein